MSEDAVAGPRAPKESTAKMRAPHKARTLARKAGAPVLVLLALIAWAYASPVGASPDDDFHLVSTWCSGSQADECLIGKTDSSRVVPLALLTASCFAFDAEASASCQGDSLAQDSAPTVDTARGNFDGLYPPLFYAVDGLLASPNIADSVLWIRAFNAAVLVGLASAAALLLPASKRVAMTLAWLITSVPLVVFLAPSNNPSSWALSGTAISWAAWWGYFETNGRRRVGLGAVAVAASVAAAGARADGAAYVALGIACVALITWTPLTLARLRALATPLVVAIACGFVVLTSRQSTAIGGLDAGPNAKHGGVSLIAKNILNLPSLWTGGFGGWGLGWLDTAMPPLVLWSAAAAFIGVVFTGLHQLPRRSAIAVGTVVFALAAIPLLILQEGGDPVGSNVQPRYIWPLVTLLAGLAIARVGRNIVTLGRTQIWLVGIALAGANSVALYTNIRRYVTGTDVQAPDLNANLEWWWPHAPSPMAVWILGSLAFAGAVTLILRDYRRVATRFLATGPDPVATAAATEHSQPTSV